MTQEQWVRNLFEQVGEFCQSVMIYRLTDTRNYLELVISCVNDSLVKSEHKTYIIRFYEEETRYDIDTTCWEIDEHGDVAETIQHQCYTTPNEVGEILDPSYIQEYCLGKIYFSYGEEK